MTVVWVFHGSKAAFASGVFESEPQALAWAKQHSLTGVITEYEIGNGSYDLAIEKGSFRPSKPHHGTPDHVASFSPSGKHKHINNGYPD